MSRRRRVCASRFGSARAAKLRAVAPRGLLLYQAVTGPTRRCLTKSRLGQKSLRAPENRAAVS